MANKILIDLHVHSEDSKYTGSNISQESDKEKLLILQKHYVKAACFSDHDNFYINSYKKRLKIIQDNRIDLVLFPGIEVNLIRFDKTIGQAVFVFDPESDLEQLVEVTSKHFRFNNNKYTYKEAVEVFNQFNFMVFPHAGKGKDNMAWEDIHMSQVDALDVTDFNSSNKKKILKQNPNIPVVSFSDTHTWRKYPQFSKYGTYVEAEPNFNSIRDGIEQNKIERIKLC
ncbi:hypothetical protein [Mycoplasma sp. Mirounga ES2805-ORL]|uniref:hypothetical protein n=1 Tax=Mycoplasma sp. Mirounga ES2805-ORL TaxID=754514 RepID=UPI00197B6804|nr:hypothetical protein [Mycoplasma sp. Mirounga ES2805-ORL]QSF13499.1 hypothetical protein JXZ90_02370 [Mycoplasma sp. Mirounga ES2805-ORL]